MMDIKDKSMNNNVDTTGLLKAVDDNINEVITEYQGAGHNELSKLMGERDRGAMSKIRRTNLRPHLKHGLIIKMALALEINANYFSQIVSLGSSRSFTDSMARKIEAYLVIPAGSLDMELSQISDNVEFTSSRIVTRLAASILSRSGPEEVTRVAIECRDQTIDGYLAEDICIMGYTSFVDPEKLSKHSVAELISSALIFLGVSSATDAVVALAYDDDLSLFEVVSTSQSDDMTGVISVVLKSIKGSHSIK